MRHIFDTDIFSKYIDERCSKQESGRLESHIAICPGCKDDFTVLQNSVTALGNLESLELPEDFDFIFNRRLEEAIKKREQEKLHEQIVRRVLEGIRAVQIRPAPVFVKALATVILILAMGFASFQYFAILSPSVLSARGKVEIFDKSRGKWEEARLALRPDRGDIIRTTEASQIDLQIPEMYSLRIKEDSQVEVMSLTRRRIGGVASFNLRLGSIFIDIDKAFRGSEFKILTPTAEAKALGTKFMVEVAEDKKGKRTWIGVLDGVVKVKSTYQPPRYAMAAQTIVVEAGQKTEVFSGSVPLLPQRLLDREWRQIQELYQIGRKPQVALLISTGKYRVRELLRPCPIYISDEEPRTIPPALEEAVIIINEAIKEKDKTKHLEAIKKLEEIVKQTPDLSFSPQFLLFIAAYYNSIDLHNQAIDTFQKVVDEYPQSTLASLAQAAIAVIYEEYLKEHGKAIEAYQKVLQNYPHSPEAFFAEEALEIQKAR